MHITDILNQNKISFSYEFFPPRSDSAATQLYHAISRLKSLQPAYVSVTYGAGGSTRDLTHDLVLKIQRETSITVVSHLTCVGTSKTEVHGILEDYQKNGITNIMALRGDLTPESRSQNRDFTYAGDLVRYIKKHFPSMGIGVAGYPEGHPETPNRLKEMDYLKAKVDEGADYICTQLFFDNNDYYDFCERCLLAGIKIPVLAGIMPITSRKGMMRMADLALGTRHPARLLKALSRAEDDELFAKVGTHWATEQVLDLIDNEVKGIHFYTLNRSKATIDIYNSLGVTSSAGLTQNHT
ncbi:5,10-methylenetetrahydrofolate reductase [Chitinispirillum alkaliphilum]|nr:5,10-methylenetetrahydrofolate reductase [Chitinispirillum alkaliphilum]